MSKNTTAPTGGTVTGGRNGKSHSHSNHNTSRHAPQPIRAASGKIVGSVRGDTFTKRVEGSKHMLLKPRGWALDTHTLDQLRALDVVRLRVTDIESGIVYTAPLDTFERYGVAINRGFGSQVVLPLGYWSIDDQQPQMGKREPSPDAPHQLCLFGDGVI